MSLHALRHVSSAISHAEALADESEDLGLDDVAVRVRARAKAVSDALDDAIASVDEIEPQRGARERAHGVLQAVYREGSLELFRVLDAELSARLAPAHLDVVERARFRLRHLPVDEPLADLRAGLERALFRYDACVDGYLIACTESQTKRDRALVLSQALRLELERTKSILLVRADPTSEAWRRIKRRTVRTKRARWLDETKAQALVAQALAP